VLEARPQARQAAAGSGQRQPSPKPTATAHLLATAKSFKSSLLGDSLLGACHGDCKQAADIYTARHTRPAHTRLAHLEDRGKQQGRARDWRRSSRGGQTRQPGARDGLEKALLRCPRRLRRLHRNGLCGLPPLLPPLLLLCRCQLALIFTARRRSNDRGTVVRPLRRGGRTSRGNSG